MKLVIGAATHLEIQSLLDFFEADVQDVVSFQGHQIRFITTGVGSTDTACSWLSNPNALEGDFWIMVGVAGAFNPDLKIGSVVEVVSETWGDLGIEHADGTFEDVFAMGLMDPDHVPYQEAALKNPTYYTELPKVKGLTVQTTSGTDATILKRKTMYNPDVESMEGAGFFQAALSRGVPFCQLRAISNRVEPRDQSRWNLPLALDQLTKKTIHWLENM